MTDSIHTESKIETETSNTVLQDALEEAITYSSMIIQAGTNELLKIAKSCLRELLDSLAPLDNTWVVQHLADWLKKVSPLQTQIIARSV